MTEAASMSDLQLLPLDQPLLPDTLARAFDITQPGTSAKSGPGSGPSSAPAPRQPAAAGATSAFAAPRQTGAAPPRAAPVDRQAGLGAGVAGQNSWSTMTAAFQAQQQRQQQQALAQAQAQAQGQPPPGTSHAAAAAAAAAAMPAASAQFPLGGLAVQSAPFPGHPGEAFLSAAAPGALPYNPYHSFPLMGAVGMPQQPFNPYLNVMPPFAGAPGVQGAMPGVGLPPGAAPSDYLAGAMQAHPLYAQLPGQMPGQMPGQLPGQMPGMPPPASHAFGAPAEQAEQKPGAALDQQQQQQQQGTSPTAAQAAAQGKVAMTKKPRVAWTPDLHARFVKAVTALGVDTAVPKQIMLAMNVEGLTRENVASHLQKFRLQLRRDKD